MAASRGGRAGAGGPGRSGTSGNAGRSGSPSARARASRGSSKPRGRERARAFVFDGQGEHERFGIFDPAARATFAVLVLIAMVIVGFTVRESVAPGNGGAAGVLGLAAALGVAVLGFLAYRAVWRPPAEREVLLQMAREEDESRALAAARKAEKDAPK